MFKQSPGQQPVLRLEEQDEESVGQKCFFRHNLSGNQNSAWFVICER